MKGLILMAASALVAAGGPPPQEPAVAKQPAGVICKDGTCSIVRRYVSVERGVQREAVAANDCLCVNCRCGHSVGSGGESGPRFNGPLARRTRAVAGATRTVGRAVAYRVTHPFGGRFRR